jgi:hypothetical protein
MDILRCDLPLSGKLIVLYEPDCRICGNSTSESGRRGEKHSFLGNEMENFDVLEREDETIGCLS